MYLRILLPLLYIIVASGIFITDIAYVKFSWLSAAVAILLYTKSARGILVYLQIRSTSASEDVLTTKYFRLLAAGYFLTAGFVFCVMVTGRRSPRYISRDSNCYFNNCMDVCCEEFWTFGQIASRSDGLRILFR
jgi:hypothetical protein